MLTNVIPMCNSNSYENHSHMISAEQRNHTFDVLKGMAIVLVIIGHLQGLYSFIYAFIFSFHMPLFFLVSGWFYKEKTIFSYIKTDCCRLLRPYYVTVFIFCIWWFVRSVFRNDYRILLNTIIVYINGTAILADDGCSQYVPITGDTFPMIGPIWFFISMFWCRQLYNLLRIKNIILKLVIALLLSYIAYVISNNYFQLPLGILPGICGMAFYAIGHYVKRNVDVICKYKFFLIPIGLIVFVYCNIYSSLSMVICHFKFWPLDIISGCFGTWILYLVSNWIVSYTSYCKIFFTWLGRNSMAVLVFHFFEFRSGIWEDFLHVSNMWYVLFPLKMILIISLLLICSHIKYVRNLYNIKNYPVNVNSMN